MKFSISNDSKNIQVTSKVVNIPKLGIKSCMGICNHAFNQLKAMPRWPAVAAEGWVISGSGKVGEGTVLRKKSSGSTFVL